MKCVQVWGNGFNSSSQCQCGENRSCHNDDGCHAKDCECKVTRRDICNLELVIDTDGPCYYYEDHRCGEKSELHCPEPDAYAMHMCHSDMVHHEYEPPYTHAEKPRWEHRIIKEEV